MIRRLIVIMATGLALLAVASCSVDTELGGTSIPNSRPDTRITGQPPALLEAGFIVQFNWTGSDPDGRVKGFQWKISDNGVDGISPQDTMTVDPLTGAVLNPWFYTESNDSLFYVLADQEDFPGDINPDNPDDPFNDYARSFRTHTLWIRAVDDDDAVDPTPAQMSFTSTTLVPTAQGKYPSLSNAVKPVPTTVTFEYEGEDPDFDLKVPSRVRFLWRPAIAENGTEIITLNRYNTYFDELINFDDPNWTDWAPYKSLPAERRISYPRQAPGGIHLFAVQVQDTAGAVSVGRAYQQQVLNVEIDGSGRFRPSVRVQEQFLGEATLSISRDIAAGQPLNFSWSASAASYNGTVVSMRHGWDLQDIDDPNDPGWAVPPGLSEQNRFAEPKNFQEGDHNFFLRVVDDSDNVTQFVWNLQVIPNIARNLQYNLLVLDQVIDEQTNQWGGQGGSPAYDKEEFRNGFWRFLEGDGGVTGFNWEEDRFDHIELVSYSDLVWYKAVLVYARNHVDQTMFSRFRAQNGNDQYVWLTPYQERGGNLFLVGSRSMQSFLEVETNYMVPIIFDSGGEETYTLNGTSYIVGFGTKEEPDGTEVERGPLQYPYLTAGIASLDWNVPTGEYIYGRPTLGSEDRKANCAGLKGVVLDPDFRDNYLIGPGAIADTIGTNPEIDWRDIAFAGGDTLNNGFPFSGDEFVDNNISSRPTPVILQECPENEFTGLCVEPMFKGLARFDWLRERKWAAGDDAWPNSTYTDVRLTDLCGPVNISLKNYVDESGNVTPLGSSRANGLTYGFASHKTRTDKPGGKPDIFWGFDPYRFDHDESKKAIRWVLDFFGIPINQ